MIYFRVVISFIKSLGSPYQMFYSQSRPQTIMQVDGVFRPANLKRLKDIPPGTKFSDMFEIGEDNINPGTLEAMTSFPNTKLPGNVQNKYQLLLLIRQSGRQAGKSGAAYVRVDISGDNVFVQAYNSRWYFWQ